MNSLLEVLLQNVPWFLIGVFFVVCGGLLVAAAGGIGAQLFLWGSLLLCGLSFMTITSPFSSSSGGLVLGDGEGLYWVGRALHFCAALIQGVGLMLLARRIRALQVPGRSGEGAVSP